MSFDFGDGGGGFSLGDFITNLFGGSSSPAPAAQPVAGGQTPIPAAGGQTPIPDNSGQVVAGGQTPIPAGSDPSSNTGQSWLSQAGNWLGNQNISSLAKNISPLIAGGGLINAIAGGGGKLPQKGPLTNIANQTMQTGQNIVGEANAGQLPPGLEQQYDQQLASTISQIQAKYAAMGLNGSSMEQQDIANAQAASQASKEQAVSSYLQQGTTMLNQAGVDYSQLAQEQMNQNKDMQTQIANLLKAFAGGGGGNSNNSSLLGS